jgi:hypothetical protein
MTGFLFLSVYKLENYWTCIKTCEVSLSVWPISIDQLLNTKNYTFTGGKIYNWISMIPLVGFVFSFHYKQLWELKMIKNCFIYILIFFFWHIIKKVNFIYIFINFTYFFSFLFFYFLFFWTRFIGLKRKFQEDKKNNTAGNFPPRENMRT